MTEKSDPKSVALAYLASVGRKDFATTEQLLAPDIVFKGPAGTFSGAAAVLGAYRRLSGISLRNEPKKTFVDGNSVCMIYEYVTSTSAGAVPTMEWVEIENGKVISIFLLTDHVRWPVVLEEMKRGAQASASQDA